MESTIAEAYELFKKHKAHRPLDICTDCCMNIKDEGLLASLPLKEVPQNLLMEYNDEASTAKTPIEELKHFLPRFLDLASSFDFPSHSTELTFRRLAPFNSTEWTNEELDYLKKFALTFFKKCLSTYPLPQHDQIESILIMLRLEQFQLDALLAHWITDTSSISTLHFKDLYLEGFKHNSLHKLSNGFADEEISNKLSSWVNNKAVKYAFKGNIETLILNGTAMDEHQLNQLNMLYEVLD